MLISKQIKWKGETTSLGERLVNSDPIKVKTQYKSLIQAGELVPLLLPDFFGDFQGFHIQKHATFPLSVKTLMLSEHEKNSLAFYLHTYWHIFKAFLFSVNCFALCNVSKLLNYTIKKPYINIKLILRKTDDF